MADRVAPEEPVPGGADYEKYHKIKSLMTKVDVRTLDGNTYCTYCGARLEPYPKSDEDHIRFHEEIFQVMTALGLTSYTKQDKKDS